MGTGSVLDLRKFLAPEFVFGSGARLPAGRYARNIGITKALVVCDRGVSAAGWTDQVVACLNEAGVAFDLFFDLTPNPKSAEVMKGAALYLRSGCDGLVAVGGGSPMDCAKGIGVVVTNGRHVLDYEGVDEVRMPMPPLLCIPTTAGTAADVSQFAIITDENRRNKIAIISKAVVPDVALIDPDMTETPDAHLAACTGMDALTHAVEAFVSNAHSPLTDIHALEAIWLLIPSLPRVVKNRSDVEAREKVTLGCLEAGLAFSNASLGAVHAMAHSLGGFLDLPHGQCNSLLLDQVIRFNYRVCPERFDQIGQVMGLDLRGLTDPEKTGKITDFIRDLREGLAIGSGLADLGVHRTDVPELAEKAFHDPCLLTNPRTSNRRDLEVIYEEAL